MTTLIKVKEIMGESNNNFTTLWDANIQMYKSILDSDNTYINKFIDYAKTKLLGKLKPYYEMESLYSLDISLDVLNDLLIEFIPELLTNSFVDSLILNKGWLDFNELGAISRSDTTNFTSNGVDTIGYEGFNLTNQDGQYNKNTMNRTNQGTNTNKVSGGATKLQYIAFLQTHLNSNFNNFVKKFRNTMLKSIYG